MEEGVTRSEALMPMMNGLILHEDSWTKVKLGTIRQCKNHFLKKKKKIYLLYSVYVLPAHMYVRWVCWISQNWDYRWHEPSHGCWESNWVLCKSSIMKIIELKNHFRKEEIEET